MSYALHLTRTEDWTQAATAPITKPDVDALIAADPELAWSTTDHLDMKDETGAITRYFMITWRGKSFCWWNRNEIECSGPDDAQILKLVQMARALNAHAVGDDGELYPLEKNPVPSSATTKPATKPMSHGKRLLLAFLLGCILLALKLLIFGGK
jgi:hypothetical protein